MHQRVTLADVAHEADVSVSAVSLVLRGRPGVGEAASRRVREAARRLGYRPDAAATALRTGRTMIAGILVRNLRNSYFTDLIAGFDKECIRQGISPLVATSDFDPARERQALQELVDRGAEAIAVAAVTPIDELDRWNLPSHVPVLVIDSDISLRESGRAARPIMEVGHDLANAVDQAVDHLVELGHRRIALFVSSHARQPTDLSIRALRAAERVGATLITRSVSYLTTDEAEDDLESLLRSKAPPTAVVFVSVNMALSAYTVARRLNLTIPDDLSVIAVGDSRWAPYLAPPLTAIRTDAYELGEVAARTLIAALEDPEQNAFAPIVLPVSTVIRDSTASPPQGATP
jgi:DNA-binding LacI/PurR family transcriptional regulator